MSTHRIARLGYRGTRPDARDLIADTAAMPYAAEVDPRQAIGSELGVFDQLQLGCCTACATSKAVDYDRLLDGNTPVSPARLAVYWGERKLEHEPLVQDTGAFGRDGFKFMRQVGYWPEASIPYSDRLADPDFYEDPVARHGPAPWKLDKPYKAVPRLKSAFKRVLSNRQTIATGFTVYESFESAQTAASGVMPIPDRRKEKVVGGHEVLIVGYLASEPDYALALNSWSERWGDRGFFLFPWKLLLDATFASDFRTIYRG